MGYVPVPLLFTEERKEGHLADCRCQPAVILNDLGAGTQTSLWAGWGSAVPAETVQETRLSLYLENNSYILEKHEG